MNYLGWKDYCNGCQLCNHHTAVEVNVWISCKTRKKIRGKQKLVGLNRYKTFENYELINLITDIANIQ